MEKKNWGTTLGKLVGKTMVVILLLLAVILGFSSYDNKVNKEFARFLIENKLRDANADIDDAKSLRFYIKYDNTAVRTCPSTECDVKRRFNTDDYLDMDATIQSWTELPEWVDFEFNEEKRENATSTTYYIHRNNFLEGVEIKE